MKNLNYYYTTAIFLLCLSTVGSAFVTVGSTGDCDYSNLEDAYNDTDAFVRVTSQTIHSLDEIISKSKYFSGGYDTCVDAENDILGNQNTRWVPFNLVAPIINIDANQATQSLIAINNFTVHGSDSHAISVSGNSTVIINNSIITDNNEGVSGGAGIKIRGVGANVSLFDTEITDSHTDFDGGGVHCSLGGTFMMSGDSVIRGNTAVGKGGGIYAAEDCHITSKSGDAQPNPLLVQYGIIKNTAEFGGGVYLLDGADMSLTGNNDHPASVVANTSTAHSSTIIIGGGGVYLMGTNTINNPNETSFTGINARIEYNQAENKGAGFTAVNSARFNMRRLDTACWDNDKCSSLSHNTIDTAHGTGAAGFVYNKSQANISRTFIDKNQAENTSIIVVDSVGSLFLEGNLITRNGPWNQVSSAQLFRLEGANGLASSVNFNYNTLTNNNAFSVFDIIGTTSQHWLYIYNSIIRDQGDIVSKVGGIDPNLRVGCNYVHEIASFADAVINVDNFNLDPGFVDAANRDYHVLPGSFSKDLCDEATIQSYYAGLNGNARGYDDPTIPNLRGSYDAGAYEGSVQNTGEALFSNGFE